MICDDSSKRAAITTTTPAAAVATTTTIAAAAAAAATTTTPITTTTTNSYTAQYPVKNYELAALYIINVNINMTIKKAQLKMTVTWPVFYATEQYI